MTAEKNLIVRLEDVSLSFGRKEILKHINLEVYEGETLAVIGPSGTGKSTLLRLIIGLLKPTTGNIWVEGTDLTQINYEALNEIRLKMGMVFQYSALFDSMDVEHNVGFALRQHLKLPEEKIQEIVTEKLRLVGLEGVESKMPSELSGGMKKRVSLARALAANPPLVLYDEPTSGLDPVISKQIDELIVKTKETLGVTSIMVTHDMPGVFRSADRVAMLYNGEITEIGTKEEFVRSSRPEVQQFLEYGLVGYQKEKGGVSSGRK